MTASSSGYNNVAGAVQSISCKLRATELPSKRLLGKGLASIVYETEWEGLRCARKDFMGVPSDIFEAEASALVRLEHDNIVKTHGWTVDKMSCSLVVEYVEDDLLGLLQHRKKSQGTLAGTGLELQEGIEVMLQIARAVAYLHGQGIIHGDLKTNNIFVTQVKDLSKNSLLVKVADFGLIQTKRKSIPFVSRPVRKLDMVQWKGPEYFKKPLGHVSEDNDESSDSDSSSHEVCPSSSFDVNDDRPQFQACDMYSFALTCYHILTGKKPYPNWNWKALGAKIVQDNFRPKLPASCPVLLANLLKQCWNTDKMNRPTFTKICEMLEDIHRTILGSIDHLDPSTRVLDGSSSDVIATQNLGLASSSKNSSIETKNESHIETNTSSESLMKIPHLKRLCASEDMETFGTTTMASDVRPVKRLHTTEDLETLATIAMASDVRPIKSEYMETLVMVAMGSDVKPIKIEDMETLATVAMGSDVRPIKSEDMETFATTSMASDARPFKRLHTSQVTQDVSERIFGMEDYFMRVKSAICEGHSKEGSSSVVIRGMEGVGKTLLAQMVNNDKEVQEVFGKDSMIWITVGREANVSGIYNQVRNRFKGCCAYRSLEDQRTDLMNAFCASKGLLILDDVRAGCVHESKDMVYWLNIARGSNIARESKCVALITTRDESVTRHCIDPEEILLGRLSEELSWQLFCTHAFGTCIESWNLDMELEGMARAVCKECGCLPLALRVIGCAMNNSDKSNWMRMFRRMQALAMPIQSFEQQLHVRLGVSYDELDGPLKICFLYFAAFPEHCEVRVKELCQIWVVEGLFGENLSEDEAMEEGHCALKDLVQRSLIEVFEVTSGGALIQVKMHDTLRDLAIHLVSKGNECERECMFKMDKGLVDFPNTWLGSELKVRRLSLWGGTFKHFPDEIVAPNLKICILHSDRWAQLDSIGSSLHYSNIGEKFFRKLHALKFLQIRGYGNVRQLPESIGEVRSLQHLDLSECWALKQLPESMGALGSLQHLDLSKCWALKQLPESMGGLGSLQHLNLSHCRSLKQLPESMAGLGSLQHLGLSGCTALEQLPKSMEGLGSLQHLDLSGCWALEQLPKSMEGLGSLQHLDLSSCFELKHLPKSMEGLGSLQHLDLSGCTELEQLPKSMEGLGSLQHLNLSRCSALKQLPESMGALGSLQHLDLSGCWALEQLPKSMGALGSLQHLDLSRCSTLKQLPSSMGGLGSLQHLDLSRCTRLEQLPKSMGALGSLQHLDLSRCTGLEQLPKSMGALGSLQHLDLSRCTELEQLPKSMGALGSLQHLDLSRCSALEQLPRSMGGLGSLQHLDLSHCGALKQLPESMGGLGSLQHLNLSHCGALKQLPKSMAGLGSLQHLNLF